MKKVIVKMLILQKPLYLDTLDEKIRILHQKRWPFYHTFAQIYIFFQKLLIFLKKCCIILTTQLSVFLYQTRRAVFLSNFTEVYFKFMKNTKKLTFFTEIAYFVGLFLLAFGTALTSFGGFGMSMVVAPAYILHKFMSQFFSWFSFAVAEYVLQALILITLTIILRKIKWSFFLSFGATILYGIVLDLSMKVTGFIPPTLAWRISIYIVGVVIICASIALLFSAYLPPEAYEMFVKEFSAKFKKAIPKVKIVYDCASLVFAIVLCTALFMPFKESSFTAMLGSYMAQGIGIGTVACAFINGPVIGLFQKLYSKIFNFKDGLKLRKYFEKTTENKESEN